MSYERLYDEEELKMVLIIINNNNNNNNNSNLVSASNSEANSENDSKNFFDKVINDEVKGTPKTNISAKVICAIKKYKLCTIIMSTKSSAMQEENAIKNLNFLLIWLWWPRTPSKHLKKHKNSMKLGIISTKIKKWQKVICKEFGFMNKLQVWCMTRKNLMTLRCMCMKNKWVFKLEN